MTTLGIMALLSRAVARLRLVQAIRHMNAAIALRRDLARLDDHLLRDIGLTRYEAEMAAARAPWDAPLHWRGEKVDSFGITATARRLKSESSSPICCA